MRTVGIDLGHRGATATLDATGRLVRVVRNTPVRGSPSRPRCFDAPGFAREARAELDLAHKADEDMALRVVAEAPAHVRIGGRLHARATGVLFLCAGLWQGAYAALGVEVEWVAATTWQHELLANVPGRTTKDRARFRARLLDPALDWNEGMADAACVAVWGRGVGPPFTGVRPGGLGLSGGGAQPCP